MYICMCIYIYIYTYIHVYTYISIYIYTYIYIYIHIHICVYHNVYIYIYTHLWPDVSGYIFVAHYTGTAAAVSPQLIFIHIHQLFGLLYTLYQLDTVNIYWLWCINLCRIVSQTFLDTVEIWYCIDAAP